MSEPDPLVLQTQHPEEREGIDLVTLVESLQPYDKKLLIHDQYDTADILQVDESAKPLNDSAIMLYVLVF